ncbi:MAG: hypothetical protein Q7T82_21055 [Armatimonadota bacterium]|nr:hypothetical protein [Armatimonadota bacterium]
MSDESGTESTWKCRNCGTLNRFESAACALCNKPRPADAVILSSTPHLYDGGAGGGVKNTGFPSSLIVLVAYEALVLLYWLYSSFVFIPQMYRKMGSMMQMPNMGGSMGGPAPDFGAMASMGMVMTLVFGLISLAVRGVMVAGWVKRWPFARVMGIVRYALSVAGGLLGLVNVVVMLVAFSAMRGVFPPGGAPGPMGGMDKAFVHMTNPALQAAVALVTLSFGIVGICFLTTSKVKEYFSR